MLKKELIVTHPLMSLFSMMARPQILAFTEAGVISCKNWYFINYFWKIAVPLIVNAEVFFKDLNKEHFQVYLCVRKEHEG